MAKIKDPVLFSAYFGISPSTLQDAGLIDPFINTDTQLFIDPILLAKSSNPTIRGPAKEAFSTHFQNFVRLLAISGRIGDAAWRAAERLLDLTEPTETGLGYGGSGRSGSSRPEEIRFAIMRTAKEIITLGARDPDMVSLMGFFEEYVGPDTISDFTTRVIADHLAKITEEFCGARNIPATILEGRKFRQPLIENRSGKKEAVLLVPRDVVRDLPVANDWSEIEAAASANRRIRERVNTLLGGIAKPTVADRKGAIRSAALESAELFEVFLQAVRDVATHYDPNKDALGYYQLKEILGADLKTFRVEAKYNLSEGRTEIISLVRDTIGLFKHHVEKGNLWEELWIDVVPKRERAAQLIYFAMADCFCIANDVDISPEANMGGGPIDFKFSKGYKARVLVEMKRSQGSVVHGYEKQLEFYKDAARTFHGFFVVIDYGDLGEKLARINAIRKERLEAGESASEIVVVDATPKASASKRK